MSVSIKKRPERRGRRFTRKKKRTSKTIRITLGTIIDSNVHELPTSTLNCLIQEKHNILHRVQEQVEYVIPPRDIAFLIKNYLDDIPLPFPKTFFEDLDISVEDWMEFFYSNKSDITVEKYIEDFASLVEKLGPDTVKYLENFSSTLNNLRDFVNEAGRHSNLIDIDDFM